MQNPVKKSTTHTPISSISEVGKCEWCGTTTRGHVIPAVFGMPAKILPPSWLCDDCLDFRDVEDSKKREQERIENLFRGSLITKKYRERTFENFRVTDQNRKAFVAASEFDPKKGKGIMFYGTCGVGKTHLAASIANRFMGKVPLLFISAPELLHEARGGMNDGGYQAKINAAKSIPLLILDDIGAEKPSEWVQDVLFIIINRRCNEELPTIFTSNCSLGEIKERLTERISSRILEMCHYIRVGGEDYRALNYKFSNSKGDRRD